MTVTNPYSQRPVLRRFEKTWSRLEIFFNRIFTTEFNPLYHLGTLGIYLLILLTITGLYLTLFYRPGTEVAYLTVERITNSWVGGIMRSVHRYASDAFLLIVVLHALKTFLSDRFWGSRWLAWLSGWGMVLVAWFLGTMGYWLVWDTRAQWLTEYLVRSVRGAVALTFINTNIASSTFAAFVIVLFVHIFLPLAILGLIIIHILRLARPRIWSPRWVMVLSGLGLVILAVLRPAVSAAPANLSQLLTNVPMDAWYLGFLPLLDQWGSLAAWGFVLALFAVASLMPWIAKGKDIGPAYIENNHCTGCALCSAECPYRAIEMQYRHDEHTLFKSIAVINPDLCTGCGLCVGTCATLGVEMKGLPTNLVYENGLIPAVTQEIEAGNDPIVVFTCHRQAAQGSLPGLVTGLAPTPVTVSSQGVGRVVTLQVACLGMVDVDWVKQMQKMGVRDVVLQGCAYDDCNYREGPQWSAARLNRRKALVKPNLHWLETAPGDARPLTDLLNHLASGAEQQKPALPVLKERMKRMPKFSWAAGILFFFLALFFASVVPLEFPVSVGTASESELRVAVTHSGIIKTASAQGVVLPKGATVDMAQIVGGERYPVQLQVWVDGTVQAEDAFTGRGLRNEGEINGFSALTLSPGQHQVELRLQDDETTWRTLYSGELALKPGKVITFFYDHVNDTFVIK